MNMIWNLRSEPEISTRSADEVKHLMREAGEAKSVRRSTLIGLMLCGLCAGAGALIGDAFSIGIYGAGIGGGVGGFVYSQVRMRAVLDWIKNRHTPLQAESGLTPR